MEPLNELSTASLKGMKESLIILSLIKEKGHVYNKRIRRINNELRRRKNDNK